MSTTARLGRRERRRARRTLRERDRRSARLAELYQIDSLLVEATRVVERGWMQHGWFAYDDPTGERRVVTVCTPRTKRTLATEQVVSACLVGAIVQAAGGPSEARSQLVQRTIDVTWHALFRGPHDAVRWCPSSPERAGHVLDLVHWNDRPDRSASEVTALLDRTRALTRAETDVTRASQPAG